MAGTFYVTTPIYYVNADPHIGHAYTTLAADSLARWHRLLGEDVRLLTGTDEHGKKIEEAAQRAGVSPQEHTDRISARFRHMGDVLGVQADDFIRTTEERHKRVVRDLWQRMEAAGDIYLGQYEGWYSVGDEAYFTEAELRDGRTPAGHEVQWVVEPSFFFRLSKYGPRLLEHLRANPHFVRPESRYNELLKFVESGLQDISVSRTTFQWGIPVPGHPDHVVYVWVDALTNYISALGGPGAPDYEKFWPSSLHLIGKDILRFHAVFWPCFLMSAGLPPPRSMFAHGWWMHAGEKMSKSLGNVVDPEAMADKYGADAFRYFLLREVTFGQDGDFSEPALRDRVNGDLANDYGNLLNRSLGMLHKYRGGVVPAPVTPTDALDQTLVAAFDSARRTLFAAMDELAFHRALSAIWELVRAGNKYADASAPWVLAREGRADRLDAVLYHLCETLRIAGTWTLAFLPSKAAELLDRLAVPADLRVLSSTAAWGGLPGGVQTEVRDPLFPRIEAPAVAPAPKSAESKGATSPAPAAAQEKKVVEGPKPAATQEKKVMEGPKPSEPKDNSADVASIEYADFARLDLRVARIVAAEKHPDADRLLKLTVDAGDGRERTVCAGIASAYKPEELVGRAVVLLANLQPRKIRGVMSEGMLLAAGDGATLHLLAIPGELPPGTKIS